MFNKFAVILTLLINSCYTYSQSPFASQLYHEGNILDLIQKFLPENPVILEAGGHYGEDSEIMAKKWPLGQMHVFEPFPHSYKMLNERVKSLPNVNTYPFALSDKEGLLNFYVCLSGDAASSLLPPTEIVEPYLAFNAQPIVVNSTILDLWASKNNIKNIDFMWLDMEGAELLMLKSSPKIVSTVKVIYTEVNFQEFREGNCFYDEIKEWLEAQGFSEIWNHLNTSWQGNVLFVKL